MPAADGLVKDKRPACRHAAQGHIVHRALAGGGDAVGQCLGQRTQHHVDDALAGFDVPGGHRSRKVGAQHAVWRRHDGDRLETAVVDRDVFLCQQSHTVPRRRADDRLDCIQVARHLWCAPCKVNRHPGSVHRDRAADRDPEFALPVSFERVLIHVRPCRDACDRRFDHAPRIVHQRLCVGLHPRPSVHRCERQQPLLPHTLRRQLSLQVSPPFIRRAAVGRDQGQQSLCPLPACHQLDRRDHDPLLVQLGAQRQRAGCHATDIGVVGAAGDVKAHLPADKDRRHHRHVGQVSPAVVRVVEDDDVARRKGAYSFDGRGDRGGHAAQVDRNVRGLGDHARLGVKYGAAEIQPLLDVGTEAGALQGHAHLFCDGGKETLEYRQADRIDRRGRFHIVCLPFHVSVSSGPKAEGAASCITITPRPGLLPARSANAVLTASSG